MDRDKEIIIVRPTLYDGVTFRSRLEARWAKFFNACGVIWAYEPHVVHTMHGDYVPDFFFPEYGKNGMYGEVKPIKMELDPRWVETAISTKAVMLLLFGTPKEAFNNWSGVRIIENDGFSDPISSCGVPFCQMKYGRGDGIFRFPESDVSGWKAAEVRFSDKNDSMYDVNEPIPRTPVCNFGLTPMKMMNPKHIEPWSR